jgi:hypothetical protein
MRYGRLSPIVSDNGHHRCPALSRCPPQNTFLFTAVCIKQNNKRTIDSLSMKSNLNAEIARQQVREAAKRYMINYDNLTPIVYTRVNPSGVLLTLRYLSDPRKRRGTEEKVWEDILTAFEQEPTIDFAYPTQRIYYHPAEKE